MLTVVHGYTYVVCCCFFPSGKIRDSRCHSEGCSYWLSASWNIAQVIDQSDCNTPLSHVINLLVHFFLYLIRDSKDIFLLMFNYCYS